jgi:hypothetical protein
MLRTPWNLDPRKKIRLSYHAPWQVDELQKPAKEKIQQQIAANMEWATQQLFEVGNQPLGICHPARQGSRDRSARQDARLDLWQEPVSSPL